VGDGGFQSILEMPGCEVVSMLCVEVRMMFVEMRILFVLVLTLFRLYGLSVVPG